MTERCDEIRVTAVQTGTANLQRLHEMGTPGRSPAERKLDILRDHEWAGPLRIFAYVVEHPEGTFVVNTGDRARNSDRDYRPS
jgi:N-acyl homoserine lactone hydrolase